MRLTAVSPSISNLIGITVSLSGDNRIKKGGIQRTLPPFPCAPGVIEDIRGVFNFLFRSEEEELLTTVVLASSTAS